jgi:hypothetical protein
MALISSFLLWGGMDFFFPPVFVVVGGGLLMFCSRGKKEGREGWR